MWEAVFFPHITWFQGATSGWQVWGQLPLHADFEGEKDLDKQTDVRRGLERGEKETGQKATSGDKGEGLLAQEKMDPDQDG